MNRTRMRKMPLLRIGLLLLAAMIWWQADGAERRRKKSVNHTPDSMAHVLSVPSFERPSTRKMSTSVYPVSIAVVGRVVKIQSDSNQLLPIYTQSGALYLITRLNKGTNWISGLPRGEYFINNRPINVK